MMVSVDTFFCDFLKKNGFVVAIFDLVHDVEAIRGLCKLLTASGNLFLNLSDACKTAICSFTGITHIPETISRCCLQLRKLKYSLHIVRLVNTATRKQRNNYLKNTIVYI